jgi:hypothetical protein
MPPKDDSPQVEVRRSADGVFVHFGVVSDGAFHPFHSERVGDYDDRVRQAQEGDSE